MQITFSTSIDRGYYLDYSLPENKNIFNRSYIGPAGLLGLLERETGLTGDYPPNRIRKIRYQAILKEFQTTNTKSFFARSFEHDPAGVAAELLKYRDQLVLAGWDRSITGISKRIDTLAAIEQKFDIPKGREDRWQEICEQIERSLPGSIAISEVIMEEDPGDLHPFFKKLFDLLQTKGVKVTARQPEQQNEQKPEQRPGHQHGRQQQQPLEGTNNLNTLKVSLTGKTGEKAKLDPGDKKSLQILHFYNETDAAEFIASQPLSDKALFPGKTVIINRNNHRFDLIQQSFGKPASGSVSHNARPQLIQLIPLSLSLFTKPVNIYNLISYLQTSLHPLPLSLRSRLLKVIAREGGIPRTKWDEVINSYIKEDAEPARDIRVFAELHRYDPEKIPINNLVKFYSSLRDWARRRQHSLKTSSKAPEHSDDLAFAELNELRTACKAITEILNNFPDETIRQKDLDVIISEITESPDITLQKPQVNSTPVFSTPGQLISDAGTIIWLDFYNSDIKPDYYTFLSEQEKNRLTEKGVVLWDQEAQAESMMKEFLGALEKTNNRLILVYSEKADDEPASKHPLLSMLNSNTEGLDDLIIRPSLKWPDEKYHEYSFDKPGMIEAIPREFSKKQCHYHINNLNLVKLRETESYSSIDKLIHYPFDWLLEYGLDLKPGRIVEPDDTNTLKGNVSHKMVEELIARAGKDIRRAKEILETDYENLLDEVTESTGALLLLEHNLLEYSLFKAKLKNSINILFDLLLENNLKVIETEHKAEGHLEILGSRSFKAYIDLLLEDAERSKVVFDLKWSRNDSRYVNMIKEGKAIQPALYGAILESNNNKVSGTAYYSLAGNRLISSDKYKGENLMHIENAPSSGDVLAKTANSVNYRLNQFKNGILEEGEEQPASELEYFDDQNTKNLIPLEEKKGSKKKNWYSNYEILKGNL